MPAGAKDDHGSSTRPMKGNRSWTSRTWPLLRPVFARTVNVLSYIWPWIRRPTSFLLSVLFMPLSWVSGVLMLVAGSCVLAVGFLMAVLTSWIAVLIFIVKLGPLCKAVWASIPRPLSHFFFSDLPNACLKIFIAKVEETQANDSVVETEKPYEFAFEAGHGSTPRQSIELDSTTTTPFLGSAVLFDPDDGVLKTDFESSGGWKIAGDMEEYKLRSRNNSELHLSHPQDRQHRRTRTGGSIRFSGASSPESARTPPLYMKPARDSRDTVHQRKKYRSASTTSSPESYFRMSMTASTSADRAEPEENALKHSPSGSSTASLGSTGRVSSHDIAWTFV